MVLTTMLWLFGWVGTGLLASSLPARAGHHAGRWRVGGAVLGPFTLPLWLARQRREPEGAEIVEEGWPPTASPGLLVVPARGPTPELVRAIADLRVEVGHVALARVIPFDSPARDVDRERSHLRSDRAALGLPGATIVLLRGEPARAIVAHAEEVKIPLVLVDRDVRGAVSSVRILQPGDVHPAPRAPAVRILARSDPIELDASRIERQARSRRRDRRGTEMREVHDAHVVVGHRRETPSRGR